MKALNWVAWISAGTGLIFILLGLLQLALGRIRPETQIINCFHAANSFFLLTIALFVYIYRCRCNKD